MNDELSLSLDLTFDQVKRITGYKDARGFAHILATTFDEIVQVDFAQLERGAYPCWRVTFDSMDSLVLWKLKWW